MWASYTSNLLFHVRSHYTYDMVPLSLEISFATGAIISHEVEAEPKSVPLTWPISRVKYLGWHVHSERFPSSRWCSEVKRRPKIENWAGTLLSCSATFYSDFWIACRKKKYFPSFLFIFVFFLLLVFFIISICFQIVWLKTSARASHVPNLIPFSLLRICFLNSKGLFRRLIVDGRWFW